jgi:WD40 repeat protein
VRDAERRAWEVVKRAYVERTPVSSPSRPSRRLVAWLVVVLAAVIAAVLSPPGRAVFHRVREAVGIEHASPALFSLPASGRLLVVSTGDGVWLVHDDGLKRRLGSYADAEWSPHGRFLVATTANELVALDAAGRVHWTLARRAPRSPRWEGTRTDTRIAYIAIGGLHVVAGDGTGDKLLDRRATGVPPAWDPARLHTLAYSSSGTIVLRNVDTGRIVWRTRVARRPSDLEWSSDGRYLALVSAKRLVILDASGNTVRTVSTLGATLTEGAFAPGSHRLAVVGRRGSQSEVRVLNIDQPGSAKLLFAGPGSFGDIAWSPDAKWLLVAWPTANQWLFLHGSQVRAVAHITEQFPGNDRAGPRLQLAGRWCCG